MFGIGRKNENGFDIVVLQDAASGTSVEIIPACGAILHAFNVQYRGALLNIVEQYGSKKEFEEAAEAGGFKSCKLSPFVCRMRNGHYHFGEQEYTIEKFYLGKHALHGLLYDASFDIVQLDANTERAFAELVYTYKATDKGYPFRYDCRVMYELQKDAALTITTVIKNHESNAIPVSDGWHPYFTFGGPVDELLLSIPCNEMLEFDSELLPTGKYLPFSAFKTPKPIGDISLDSSFLVDFENASPAVVLRDAQKKLQLEIRPDRSYPIVQLYIPGHRWSIAIENLSGAPDAFNNGMGLTVLPAGGEAVFSTTYTLSSVS